MRHVPFLAAALVAVFVPTLPSQGPDDGWEIVIDSGNRIVLKDARFVSGTTTLGWLGDGSKLGKDKGPVYLEFREQKKTSQLKDDVVIYVPIASLARLDYHHAKHSVLATVKQ